MSSKSGLLAALGPGFITGASDDDPSGVATYAQAGARFGYGLVWTALITFPLMAAVQDIADRTALTTGHGLGELAAERLKRIRPLLAVLMVALIGANVLNIGADLIAVGSGMQLLHAGPSWLWAAVAGVAVTVLVMFGSFPLVSKVFRVLAMSLVAYIVVVFLSGPSLLTVLRATVVPHIELDGAFVAILVAVLGTTISPYLFFWQSQNRIEEMRGEPAGGRRVLTLGERSPAAARQKKRRSRLDVVLGMGFSNLAMWAIMISTAATIGRHPTDIRSAAQAATALQPLAGGFASKLFALGFIGTGMLAVPILAGSGAAALAGLTGRPWGFSRSFRNAPAFYLLVVAGTLGGTILTLLRVNPIRFLVVSATVNGFASVPFLIVLMLVSRDRAIMRDHRNSRLTTILGWTTVALMSAAALQIVVSALRGA